MATLYLSLGTNLGDRQKNLSFALEFIGREVGTVVSASDIIETEPWGFKSSNRFLNMAVKVETRLKPLEALKATQEIERRMGRGEKSVNGEYHDRPIDIDILLYDDLVMNTPQLTIPHPHMYEREFVMKPLAQIAPELIKN
ncbi:MAG: 2-amino-4-hydroxy-6-hydroxymethyldihydropteridine diphosphokinase [Bacteroidaceae bacterium]|nr:2-amino-4-hydroxy-6-hydroxymethyldihydropteridine diphosphokinase [Bacteroidaceae bacterium]